jgi:1-acyl-sn-glycerol-3-phosphate acyltransferase
VVGLENMPEEPCVILSKHQSAWETMTIQDYVPHGAYCVFVLKKELLRVPLIGWGLAAMKMISIDRAAGKQALDQVVEQGRERLKKGFYVIIFPEGDARRAGREKTLQGRRRLSGHPRGLQGGAGRPQFRRTLAAPGLHQEARHRHHQHRPGLRRDRNDEAKSISVSKAGSKARCTGFPRTATRMPADSAG